MVQCGSDITERKTAEIERTLEKINQSISPHAALMDSLPVSVWICDADETGDDK